MNWIELTESQPEFDVPVLVCDEFNSFVSMGKLIELTEDNETVFELMNIENVEIDSFITHWMPLPQAVGILNEL